MPRRNRFYRGAHTRFRRKALECSDYRCHQIASSGKVIFGSNLIYLILVMMKISYQIVGDEEADIKANKLVYSPIGRALIGKEEGAEVLVETPGGQVEYEILKVQHL